MKHIEGFLLASCLVLAGCSGARSMPEATSLPTTPPVATQAQAAPIEESQAAVASACYGSSIPSAATYSGGAGPHPILLVSTEGEVYLRNRAGETGLWNSDLPASWLPSEVSAVELVACLGPEAEQPVERCSYIGGPPIIRYQHEIAIRVVAARTGEVVAQDTLRGSYPSDCPSTAPVSQTRIDGTNVYFEQVVDYLEPLVERGEVALRTFEVPGSCVDSVTWSPEGTRVAVTTETGRVLVWAVLTGEVLETLDGHTDRASSVAWSPDGSLLASGSFDMMVILWNATTGEQMRVLAELPGWVESVSWSPDGQLISASTRGTQVFIWEAASGRQVGSLQSVEFGEGAHAWSPDGATIALAEGRTVTLWDYVTGQPVLELQERHGDSVTSIAWSPDGTLLASGSTDAAIILWDAANGTPTWNLWYGHERPVVALAFSPDGTRLPAHGIEPSLSGTWHPARQRTRCRCRIRPAA